MIRQHCKTITHVTNIKNAGLIQVWNTSSETPVRSRRPKAQGQAGGDNATNGQENGHGLNGQENDSLDGSSTDEGSLLGSNGTVSTVQTGDPEVTPVQTLNIPDGPESVPSAQTTSVDVTPSSSLPARALAQNYSSIDSCLTSKRHSSLRVFRTKQKRTKRERTKQERTKQKRTKQKKWPEASV